MKIDFVFDKPDNYHKKLEYPDILKLELPFKIFVDDVEVLNDNYFPILEFIYYSQKWIDESTGFKPFEYESVEFDKLPIILVSRDSNHFYLSFPYINSAKIEIDYDVWRKTIIELLNDYNES